MPIILAIEPDRRQRHVLGSLVRHRVGAELILADTTEHALEAIGNRVPDLVLVPALLSPQDDAALAAALRVIAAAAHVRTLTIPVLASESKSGSESRSGLLSRWRRGRDASPAPDGCDPAVFADQVKAYLGEAAAARALQEDAEPYGDATLETSHPMAAAAGVVQEPALVAADQEFVADEPVYEPLVPPIAEPPVAVQPVAPAVAGPRVQERALFAHFGGAEPAIEQEELVEEDIDLSGEVAELGSDEDALRAAARDVELFDGEPVAIYTMPALDDVPAVEPAAPAARPIEIAPIEAAPLDARSATPAVVD